MFKVAKLLPVVLVLCVASAQAADAATTVVPAAAEGAAVVVKEAAKEGYVAKASEFVKGVAASVRDFGITKNMRKSDACYYSVQALKVAAVVAAAYAAKVAYDKYYATEEIEVDVEFNS